MKKVTVKIGGMGCEHCKNTIEEYLNKQEGIKAVVSLENNNASIEYDDSKLSLDDIETFIEDTDYEYLGLE